MAELPHIGTNCSSTLCNQLDFLPFQCKLCKLIFCVDHKSREAHGCTAEVSEVQGTSKTSVDDFEPCCFEGCSRKELAPIFCSGCEGKYCLTHRYKADHNCKAHDQNRVGDTHYSDSKNREIPHQKDSSTQRLQAAKAKKNPTAQKVLLMKLKMKAIGESSVPQQERLYLLLSLPSGTSFKSQSKIAVYVCNGWSWGRAVDGLAKLIQLKNENRKPDSKKLRLYLADEPEKPLPMDRKIIEEKLLTDGDELLFKYDE